MTDIQEDVIISGNAIKGKLKYLDSGDIADQYGAGYYMALDFSDNDFSDLTSVQAGMSPSAGIDMIELVGSESQNGVFKVSNKYNQKFVIKQTDSTSSRVQVFDLSQLEFVKN